MRRCRTCGAELRDDLARHRSLCAVCHMEATEHVIAAYWATCAGCGTHMLVTRREAVAARDGAPQYCQDCDRTRHTQGERQP